MPDFPPVESTVEDRLTAYFGGGKPAQPAPQAAEPPVSEESPEVEEPQAEVAQSDEQEPVDDEQVSDEGPPEGFVELEHLGKRYFVAPEVKTAFEANRAQGTRATQEIANVRRAVEIERQALIANKAFESEVGELNARKAQLQSYKEQASKLDWSSLTLDQKVDLDRELRTINEQLTDLDKTIEGKRGEHRQKFNQYVVQAVQSTEQYMGQKVPGWSNDTGKALHDYGLNLGIPVEKLISGWFSDPVAAHTMWKAQQWDRLQSSRPGVTNKAASAPPVVKPGSNAVAQAQKTTQFQKARTNLKKSGSLEDFAAALLASQRKR